MIIDSARDKNARAMALVAIMMMMMRVSFFPSVYFPHITAKTVPTRK